MNVTIQIVLKLVKFTRFILKGFTTIITNYFLVSSAMPLGGKL
jgi:hypothetical protein